MPLVRGGVSGGPPGGTRVVFQLTGAFAEFERTMIRQRVKADLFFVFVAEPLGRAPGGGTF